MHLTRFSLALALVVASSVQTSAQASRTLSRPVVDLLVEHVVSGGHWEDGKAAGRYRAIVIRQGWEEVRRQVRLEWIQESATRGPDSLRQSLVLNDQIEVYALSDPAIRRDGARWILRLKAAAAPLAPYDRVVELELGPPGEALPVQRR